MSQGDVPRHEGAEGDTKLACLQGDVPMNGGAEGTKLAGRKAMCLGMKVSKETQGLHVARRCG